MRASALLPAPQIPHQFFHLAGFITAKMHIQKGFSRTYFIKLFVDFVCQLFVGRYSFKRISPYSYIMREESSKTGAQGTVKSHTLGCLVRLNSVKEWSGLTESEKVCIWITTTILKD